MAADPIVTESEIARSYNELCRLCASRTTYILGVHIFQNQEISGPLLKKIELCLPIHVHESDDLPKLLCDTCYYKLNLLYEFHERTVRTERLLIELLKQINDAKLLQNQQISVVPIEHDLIMVQNSQLLGNHGINSVDEMDLVQLEPRDQHIIVNGSDFMTMNHSNITHHHSLDHQVHSSGLLVENGENARFDHHGDSLDLIQHHHLLNDQFRLHHELSHVGISNGGLITEATMTLHMKNENTGLHNEETTFHLHHDDDKTNLTPIEDSNSTNSILIDERFTTDASTEKVYIISTSEISNDSHKNQSESQSYESFEQFHECSLCYTAFASQEMLEIHQKEAHLPSKAKHDSINLIEEKNESDVEESEEDLLDEEDETDDKALEKSPKSKKGWLPKDCKECGKTYKTNYKLNEHMRKHTGEKPYKCDSCDKEFRSKIGLAQHAAKHTGKYDFSCPTCGKGFQCKSYLMVHQRVHSDDKPYPCTTCGRNFKTKQSLLDHTNRHLGVKPYLCDTCGRAFITKGLCKAHQKVHTGLDNRKYSCKVCNKRFVSKSYLQTHLRIHTGEKPFICEVCGKGFLTKVDLRIHTTMHTGEKSYVCESCGKAFARRDALRCHRRSHTGERPYSCEICGQTFTQFTPMAIHKRLHTGERPYSCEHCDKTFVSRSTMMSHAKKHLR